MNVYQISQSWKQYDNYLVDSFYSAQFLVHLLNTMVWGIWLLSAVCVCGANCCHGVARSLYHTWTECL